VSLANSLYALSLGTDVANAAVAVEVLPRGREVVVRVEQSNFADGVVAGTGAVLALSLPDYSIGVGAGVELASSVPLGRSIGVVAGEFSTGAVSIPDSHPYLGRSMMSSLALTCTIDGWKTPSHSDSRSRQR
jgi:hypothetical protein